MTLGSAFKSIKNGFTKWYCFSVRKNSIFARCMPKQFWRVMM